MVTMQQRRHKRVRSPSALPKPLFPCARKRMQQGSPDARSARPRSREYEQLQQPPEVGRVHYAPAPLQLHSAHLLRGSRPVCMCVNMCVFVCWAVCM